ncbi:MAG: hypothetical protein HY038_05820, partial [Nitrospirae bacterium]|nr:hypothetical protein [Nitrospirota bacterium]
MRIRIRQRTPFISLAVLFYCATFLFLTFAGATSIQPVWAAPAVDRDHRPRASTHSKKPHLKATPASLAPVTIHNFRVMTGAGKTRLVLDLDRHAKVIEQRATNPSRVVIALPNASMSRSAQIKATDGTVPSPFMVTQTMAHAVAVSLPTAAFRTYRQFPLSNPPRLVIDVTPPIEQNPTPSP